MASASSLQLSISTPYSSSTTQKEGRFLGFSHLRPTFTLPQSSRPRPVLACSRRRRNKPNSTNSPVPSSKKKKKIPSSKGVGKEKDLNDDPFEALFQQLAEDLENDVNMDDDDDDDITEEELAELEHELDKVLEEGELMELFNSMNDKSGKKVKGNVEEKEDEEEDELEEGDKDEDKLEEEEDDDDDDEKEITEEELAETNHELGEVKEEHAKLSRELGKVFEETGKELAEINREFGEVEEELAETNRELDKVFEETRKELAEINREINREFGGVEEELAETNRELEETEEELAKLGRKLDKVFKETGEELAELDRKLNKVLDETEEKLERKLDQELEVKGNVEEEDDEEEDELEEEEDDDDDDDEEEDGLEEDDEEEDESDEEETKLELRRWQLKRLAYALKTGRRKANIKNLAADLCLDRAIVLKLLRDPPPELLMFSATLPDEEPEETFLKPEIETVTPPVKRDSRKLEAKKDVPIHVLRRRWSTQKGIKKVHVETLERVYQRTKRPTGSMVSNIVHVTSLPRRTVVKWFEDKRNKDGVPDHRKPYERSVTEPGVFTSS